MNEAFLGPFTVALLAAVVDTGVARNANLLALVPAAKILSERPGKAANEMVIFDIPLGGRAPAYVHGTDGDAKAHWSRFQVTGFATEKYTATRIMDAVIQAIDGRDIVVSDAWGTVRLFQRLAPHSTSDIIAQQMMRGVFARYEVLLLG
jgi:hypothetical protein